MGQFWLRPTLYTILDLPCFPLQSKFPRKYLAKKYLKLAILLLATLKLDSNNQRFKKPKLNTPFNNADNVNASIWSDSSVYATSGELYLSNMLACATILQEDNIYIYTCPHSVQCPVCKSMATSLRKELSKYNMKKFICKCKGVAASVFEWAIA